jgi:hypothetical protein
MEIVMKITDLLFTPIGDDSMASFWYRLSTYRAFVVVFTVVFAAGYMILHVVGGQ